MKKLLIAATLSAAALAATSLFADPGHQRGQQPGGRRRRIARWAPSTAIAPSTALKCRSACRRCTPAWARIKAGRRGTQNEHQH